MIVEVRSAPVRNYSHRGALRPMIAVGLLAGALDLVFATTFWALRADVPAIRIFQSIASGLLGQDSFAGGWSTAVLGLGLHFFIAVSMSVVYWLAARRWSLLWRKPVACGAGYGLLLYAVMNFIVIPLCAANAGSKDTLWITLSVLVHVVIFGIPIALAARRAMSKAGREFLL